MIDFAHDLLRFQAPIAAAVAGYANKHADPATAAAYPPVARIDFDLWLGDGGGSPPAARLHFDTRDPSLADADWDHPELATIAFLHWQPDIYDDQFQARMPDGKTRTINSAKFDQTLHRFFVHALLAARDAGLFAPLPKTADCQLHVANFDCGFFWPDFDDQGLENMADPKVNGQRRSNLPPRSAEQRLDEDQDLYDLWLDIDPSSQTTAIAALNSALNIGLPAARALLESKGPIARDLKAPEIHRLAQIFRAKNLNVRTEPPFPHPLT
jgi:hypothetical protein